MSLKLSTNIVGKLSLIITIYHLVGTKVNFPTNFLTETFFSWKKKIFSSDLIFVVVYIKFPIAIITDCFYLFVSFDLAKKNTEENIHSFMF